jgi:hypothetical protein
MAPTALFTESLRAQTDLSPIDSGVATNLFEHDPARAILLET